MPYRCTIQPAEEPITLAEAKNHLRLDETADDALVAALIAAARQQAEAHTGRAFVTQTWELTADRFPWFCGNRWTFDGRAIDRETIRLPLGTLAADSVEITYVDTDGATQTLAAARYQVDAASEPARLVPAYATCWPATRCQTPNAVTVAFTAGYGTAADVPQSIKQAMLLLIGHWYEVRTAVNIGNIVTTVDFAVDALLAPYRLFY